MSDDDTTGRSRPGEEHVPTVVTGGGQAGLAMGHHLARRGRSFVILEAGERVGDAWRRRWDSLRLLDLPAAFDDGGQPVHHRGIVAAEPGLHLLGLTFLHTPSSGMIHGVERDAGYIADAIAARPPHAGHRPAARDSISQ